MIDSPQRQATRPKYERKQDGDGYIAIFSESQQCIAWPSRLRHYPGLRSSAPCTKVFYQGFASLLDSADTIWDIGCGTGAGISELPAECEVVGIDSDAEALLFARLLQPNVEFVQSFELAQSKLKPSVVLLVDTLGFVSDPQALLWSLRQSLGEQAVTLLIAEPQAFPTQTLSEPSKLALTRRSLNALLVRAGFQGSDWVSDAGGFLLCRAHTADQTAGTAFSMAETDQQDAVVRLTELSEDCYPADLRIEALLQRADIALRCDQLDEAASCYLELLKDSPKHPLASAGLSQLALGGDETSQAFQLAITALEEDPCAPEAACAMALCAETVSTLSALEAWEVAARLLPREGQILSRQAECAANAGLPEQAISALEQLKAAQVEPDVNLHITLAHLLVQTGRRSDAFLEARMAQALAPEIPEVKTLLAELETSEATTEA